jgi:hypothetical protein
MEPERIFFLSLIYISNQPDINPTFQPKVTMHFLFPISDLSKDTAIKSHPLTVLN